MYEIDHVLVIGITTCMSMSMTTSRSHRSCLYFLKTPTPMTPFDEATASGLRMLKLFLPLFPPATQSMLAVFIKFIELQNVLHHQAPVSYDALSACDFSSGRGIESLFQDNADSIFDHLSPYLTSEEKQLFSTFKNIKEMMSMADMFTQFFSSAPPSDEEPEDTINNNSPKGDLNNGKLDEPSCNENDRSAQAGTDQDSRETDERKIWK